MNENYSGDDLDCLKDLIKGLQFYITYYRINILNIIYIKLFKFKNIN